MIADKIKNASKALGVFGGKVNEEVWATIKCIRAELADAADQVAELESNLDATSIIAPEPQPAAAAAQA